MHNGEIEKWILTDIFFKITASNPTWATKLVGRFLVSGARYAGSWCQVPGVQLPGVRCQVPGVRCRVRRFKRKVQTYFTSQRKLQTYRHIFHYANFLYGNVKIVYS